MDDFFEEADKAAEWEAKGFPSLNLLSEAANHAASDVDFIAFCIDNGMWNQYFIDCMCQWEMSEHDPFSFHPAFNATQHDVLQHLWSMFRGAKAWHEYLQAQVRGIGVRNIDRFLEFYQPKERL